MKVFAKSKTAETMKEIQSKENFEVTKRKESKKRYL